MKIVCIGDSMVYGFGVTRPFTWCAKAQEFSGHTFVNKGINGDTAPGMLARLDRDGFAENPDALFVMGGYNDIFFSDGPQVAKSCIGAMYHQSVAKRIPVLIGIPAPISARTARDDWSSLVDFNRVQPALYDYRNWLREFCRVFGCPTVDFDALFRKTPEAERHTQFLDGLHPNKAMHEQMGRLMADRIAEIFAK